jgi:hypothetical protein
MQSSKGSWKIVHVRIYTILKLELGGSWPRVCAYERFQKDSRSRSLQP